MGQEPGETARSTAIEQLRAFDLSAYAARTFVALVTLGGGTAEEVNEVAEVPRTRVYDAVSELEGHGLVDIQQSTPQRFWPVSAETANRHFERYYQHRVARLGNALGDLEPDSRPDEQGGVWTVTGMGPITDRVVEFVDGAEAEVVFMSVESLLTDDVVAALGAASERGVTIRLGGIADGVEADIRETVPDAEVFESIWDWSDTPAGRLLMVDGSQTLVSVLVDDEGGESIGYEVRDEAATERETAIWGSGANNSLVVVLRAMFTWQLDGER